MKVAELIRQRQPQWQELEGLVKEVGGRLGTKDPARIARFSELYRAACADLALAEAYQLPPQTVDYLHQLVARAHNQLYRSTSFQWQTWARRAFRETPQLIFRDRCVHFAFLLFWGLFLTAAYLSYDTVLWPDFAAQVVGEEQLDTMTDMYQEIGRTFGQNSTMTGYYINNNAGIGLRCFVSMLAVLPGLVTLGYNAVLLGSVFGYMFRPELGEAGANFKHFVTAHGPFELTAVVLAAGAGLKIGLSWIVTGGLSRLDSLKQKAQEALPIALVSVALFCLAAMIEGFISPMPEKILPWWVKGAVAIVCSCLMMFYFVGLGFPRPESQSSMEGPG